MTRKAAVSKRPSGGAPGSLTLCGLGIDRPQDATLATVQAVKDADVVYYMHGDGRLFRPFLGAFCRDVRLTDSPKYARLDLGRDVRPLGEELCAEMARGRRVAYLTYGHPLIFSEAFLLMNFCRRRGFACRVLPGISAVDAILAELSDLSESLAGGHVTCNADQLLDRPELLSSGLPAILLCVDSLIPRGLYERFCDRLEERYPPAHPLCAVKCRDSAGDAARLDGSVRDARAWASRIPRMTSFVLLGR